MRGYFQEFKVNAKNGQHGRGRVSPGQVSQFSIFLLIFRTSMVASKNERSNSDYSSLKASEFASM